MSGTPHRATPARSWRRRPATTEERSGGKRLRRAVWSVLFLALVGVLIWVLVGFWLRPEAQFAYLPVIHYDPLAVPPLRFCREDEVAFLTLPSSSREQAVPLDDLERSSTITSLSSRVVVNPRDSLIVYVAAHGVVDPEDGRPWLLCSDFSRPGQKGRCKLEDLLEQVRRCRAAVKLVVLDTGHLMAAPRLGMVVNAFPQLVEKEVQSVQDRSLWVLTAARPLEVSHHSESARRSVFSYFVTEGLRGEADKRGNADGIVDLEELYKFVRAGVASWVRQQSDRAETQTPCLYQGEVGAVASPPRTRLRQVSGQPADEQAKDPQEEALSAGNSVTMGLLAKAWALRDKFQDRGKEENWTFVDYAPLLWREYQERILACERRYRAGTAFEGRQLDSEINTEILHLEQLLQDPAKTTVSARSPVIERLADARRQFHDQRQEKFEAWARQNPSIRRAIQLRNDLGLAASYGVRWHAATLQLSGRDPGRFAEPAKNLKLLLQHLQELATDLERLEGGAESPASAEKIIASLDQRTADLAALGKGMAELWQSEAAKLAVLPADPQARRARSNLAGPIDAMLETPLLSERLRMPLVAARRAVDQPLSAPGDAPEPPAPSQALLRRLHDQAEMEEQLAELGGLEPGVKLTLPKPYPSLGDQVREQFWQDYHDFGKQLWDVYRQAPEKADAGLAAVDRPAKCRGERLLRLVDARDSYRVEHGVVDLLPWPALGSPPLPPAPKVRAPKEITLAVKASAPLTVNVEAGDPAAREAEVKLQYQSGDFEITREGDGGQNQTVKSGEQISVALDQDGKGAVRFQISCTRATGQAAPLTVTARCGQQESSAWPIAVKLPKPDRVDLIVRPMGAKGDSPCADDGTRIELRPFPNRSTGYRFELWNDSSGPKEVSVELVAVAELAADRPLRAAVLDDSGELRPEVKRLVGPVKVQLKPGERKAVPFPELPPPVEKPPAKPGVPEPPPEKPIDLTENVVCLVRDEADRENRWLRRIAFSPWTPKEYVRPRVTYDVREQEIAIEVKADNPDAFPPDAAANPVIVLWENMTSGQFKAELRSATQVEWLRAKVSADVAQTVLVWLKVDDYPRAFQYEGAFAPGRTPKIEAPTDLRDLRITAPQKPEQEYAVSQDKELPVLLKFEVDAPKDAFRDPRDKVKIRVLDVERDRDISTAAERREFSSNRQTRLHLAGANARGEVRVFAKVGDFEVPLMLGRTNEKVRLAVELSLNPSLPQPNPNLERRHGADSVRLILDANRPKFKRVRARPNEVLPGERVEVTAELEPSVSRIAKVRFGIEDSQTPGKALQAPKEVDGVPRGDGAWSAYLPTKELADPREYKVLVRAANVVGETLDNTATLIIKPPPVEKPVAKPAAPKNAPVVGYVRSKTGEPLGGIKVYLDGAGQTKETSEDGKFVFPDVKPGDHWLKAEGSLNNQTVKSEWEKVECPQKEPKLIKLGW